MSPHSSNEPSELSRWLGHDDRAINISNIIVIIMLAGIEAVLLYCSLDVCWFEVVNEARELYREQGAVQILQKFRTNTNGSVSCMALILQVCTALVQVTARYAVPVLVSHTLCAGSVHSRTVTE